MNLSSLISDKILPRSFYAQNPEWVAKNLLGKILINEIPEGIVIGKVVETEAYYGEEDPASHAYHGKTERSKIMWERPGIAYVYFTYGMHYLFNVVADQEGRAGAVLIRAVEPLKGIKLMKKRRKVEKIKELTNGPAKLTQAFAITGKNNGADLTCGPLTIIKEEREEKFKIVSTGRIGIKNGKKAKLRFYLENSEFVSKK